LRGTTIQGFATTLSYQPVEFHDADAYFTLRDVLEKLDEQRGTQGNRIFYLSTAPDYYESIVEMLGTSGLAQRDTATSTFHRLLIEKPFGESLHAAVRLNDTLNR
jgi:glucose-6-phosphate 1-dehydrogenase